MSDEVKQPGVLSLEEVMRGIVSGTECSRFTMPIKQSKGYIDTEGLDTADKTDKAIKSDKATKGKSEAKSVQKGTNAKVRVKGKQKAKPTFLSDVDDFAGF